MEFLALGGLPARRIYMYMWMTHSNIFDTEKLTLQTLLVKNHSGFSGNFLGCYIMIIANRLIDIGHREYITRKHSGLKGLAFHCILQRINHWRCNVPMFPHIWLLVCRSGIFSLIGNMSVCWSVCHNVLKGREVALPWSLLGALVLYLWMHNARLRK